MKINNPIQPVIRILYENRIIEFRLPHIVNGEFEVGSEYPRFG